MAVPEFVDARVAAHLPPAEFGSRNLRERVERQTYGDVTGRRRQQRAKLPFRRVERGVGHVVDEADVEAIRIGLVEAGPVCGAGAPVRSNVATLKATGVR